MHRSKLVRFVAFPCVAMFLLVCCDAAPQVEPAQAVRIVTGRPGGALHQLSSLLMRSYNSSKLGIDASILSAPPLSMMLNMLNEGAADLAIARADIAYAAYFQGTQFSPRPHTDLRGIAVTFTSSLHVVVKRDSPIASLRDLRGKRVGYTSPSSGVTPTVRLLDLVSSSGAFAPGDLESVGLNVDEMIAALAAGTLDGGFMMGSDPVPVLGQLERLSGFRLLEVPPDAALRIRAQYPFYKPVLVRAGTYPGPVGTRENGRRR